MSGNGFEEPIDPVCVSGGNQRKEVASEKTT